MAEMTVDQQKAVAMANARLRLQQQAPTDQPTDQNGELINFGASGSLVSKMPEGAAKNIVTYFGQPVADAVNSAYDQIKNDWEKKNTEEAAAKDAGFWERQKHLFNAQISAGKLPVDAFGLAMSGITGLINATVVDPLAMGMQAAHHIVGADVSLDQERNDVANALWAIAPEKGPMREGFPAKAAPTQSELQAGQAALATQKTGDAAAVKDTGHIGDNLAAAWAKTGEDPLSLTQRAQTNPVLREQLVGKQPEAPPAGSSVTKTDHGDFVLPKYAETHRASMYGDEFDQFTEGGSLEYPGRGEAPREDELNTIRDQTEAMVKAAGKVEEDGKLPPDAFDAEKSPAENLAMANKWAAQQDAPASTEEALNRIHLAQPKRPSFSVSKVGQDLYNQLFDEKAPLKRLLEAARQGKPIDEFVRDPEILERLATGSKGRAKYSFDMAQVDEVGNIVGPSFEDILKPVSKGEDFVNFEKYITSVRAQDWLAKGKETGLDPASTQMIANDPALKAKFGPVLDQLVAWRNNELGMLERAGFIDNAAKLINEEPYPIPFQREFEDEAQRAGAAGRAYQPIKAATGSERPIYGPIEQIMRQSLARHDLVAHNIANSMLADELAKAGFATKGGVTRAIPLTEAELNSIAHAAGGQDLDGFDQTIFRHFNYPLRDDEVPVFQGGKMYPYRFSDPEVAKILRGQGGQAPFIWTKIMRGFASVQRAGIVLDPTFPLRQIFYDVPFQFVISNGVRNTLAEFTSGLIHGLTGSEMDDLYRRSGAWRPLFDDINDKYIRNQVAKNYDQVGLFTGVRNIVNSPIRALKAWSQAIYTAQRRGRFIAETKADLAKGQKIADLGEKAYRKSLAKSKDVGKATAAKNAAIKEANQALKDRITRDAMNATFHTDERGSWSREVNLVQPFFSAYLNSIKRTGQAFDIFHQPANAALNIGKAIAIFTVPAVLDHLAFRGQPWYDNTPEWKKDMGLVLPPIHEGEDPIFIPQTPLLRTFFGAIPRRIIESELENNRDAFKGFAGDLVKEMIPFQATYNAALPIVENIANYSFFRGRPLYAGPKVSAPMQYTNYTSPLAKQLASGLSDIPLLKDFKLTPWQIDNLISGWGGAIGQKLAKLVGPEEANIPPEAHWADSPWVGAFFIRYPSATAEPIMDYYDKRDEFQQAHGDLEKALSENNLALFQKLAQQTPAADAGRFRPARGERPADMPSYLQILRQNRQAGIVPALNGLRKVDRRMTLLRQTEQKIIHDNTVDAHDKRQLLDQIYGEMIEDSKLGSEILDTIGK